MSGIILAMTDEARVAAPRPGSVRLFANMNGTLSLKASDGGVSSDIGSAVIEAPGSIEPSGVTLVGPSVLGRIYPGAGEAEGIVPADLAALVAPYLSTGGSPGSGTVTSVALTMPTGFSVANSPITSAGTLAVSTTLNGWIKGNGSGFTAVSSIAISDVTGLQTALDGKAASSHTHTASQITDFTEAAQDVVGAMVTAAGGSYDDGAGTITLPGGGSDPWTYIKLASDFVTSSTTAVDITGMAFTPAANTHYEFEALLMLRTATATVGPRPGIAWPSGCNDGVASVEAASSQNANVIAHGNIGSQFQSINTGLPTTTGSWPARVMGSFSTGASPTGSLKIILGSETGGTNVTVKAGSFLKYRTI